MAPCIVTVQLVEQCRWAPGLQGQAMMPTEWVQPGTWTLIRSWSMRGAAVPNSIGTLQLPYLHVSVDRAEQCQQTAGAADGSLQVVRRNQVLNRDQACLQDLTTFAASPVGTCLQNAAAPHLGSLSRSWGSQSLHPVCSRGSGYNQQCRPMLHSRLQVRQFCNLDACTSYGPARYASLLA
jgi:hypothetical protein